MKSRLLAVLAFFPAFALPAAAADNPIQSLGAIGKHLDAGIAAFLAGKPLRDAFAPWTVEKWDAEKSTKARDELAATGAKSAKHISLEYEVILTKAGKAVYYLRTAVWAEEANPRFLSVKGRATDEVPSKGRPIAELKDATKPLADAAQALRTALVGDGWKTLPWVDAEKLKAVLPEEVLKEAVDTLEEEKKELESVAKAVAAAGADGLVVRLDDLRFIAFDSAQQPVAWISAEMEIGDAGSLSFDYEGSKPLR
jgi:hypothetical protein